MRTVQIALPDQLADDAQEAGLLAPEKVESWLREQLKAQRIDELFAAMKRMAAVPDPPPMSPDEVAEEIRAIRAEERSANSSSCD